MKTNTKEDFNKHGLRRFMREHKFSDSDIARAVGFSPSQICRALHTGQVSKGFAARFNDAMVMQGWGFRIVLGVETMEEFHNCPSGCGGKTEVAGEACDACLDGKTAHAHQA